MKNLVFSLAAAVLLFASCTKEETTSVVANNEPDAIGFDFSTGKTGTRATSSNLATLKGDTSGIGIYANNTSSPTKFIDNEAYKWDVTNAKWIWASTEQKWPTTTAGYPIDFYAYYPKSETSLTSTLTKQYTINTNPTSQKDLLAANQLGVATRPISSNVALNFQHILSKIDFKLAVGPSVTVEVQSIVVRNAGSVRTFDYSTLAWTSTNPTTNTGYAYMTAPVAVANKFVGSAAATPASVTGSSGSMMLIPQDFSSRAWAMTAAPTSSDAYLEVVYRMYDSTTNKDVVGYGDATKHPDYVTLGSSETGGLWVKVGYPLPTVWNMGKAYTYTIYLGTLDASGGNLVDPDFMDDSGADSGLPVVDPSNNDPIIVPDPIVDTTKPIGFTVSVTDWVDEAGINLK
jgi:hypothetical protein